MPSDDPRTLVGVDLGGSGFRVRRLRLVSRAPLVLETEDDDEKSERRWPDGVFDERERSAAVVGGERCASIAAAIGAALAGRDAGSTLVALAAPGAKTADGRGIERALHFPAVRDLVGAIARALPGVALALPIFGDGVAAARGEQVAPSGALRDVARGYYLGGGTGVSEALVVDGVVRALNELEPPLARLFEQGADAEASLAPRAMSFEQLAPFAQRLAALVAGRRDWLRRHRPGAEPPLERVVLGQGYARCFAGELGTALLERLGPGYRISPLRAAPAIGAIAFALDPERRSAWVTS